MVSMLTKGEQKNEAVRPHSASKDSPDLPTVHASDLPTPNNVSDVELEVASCRHVATLNTSGVQRPTAGKNLRAGASIAISRERDRCQIGVHLKR